MSEERLDSEQQELNNPDRRQFFKRAAFWAPVVEISNYCYFFSFFRRHSKCNFTYWLAF